MVPLVPIDRLHQEAPGSAEEVPTMNDNNMQFGPTGIADAGARLRVQEGPALLRHLLVAAQTEPGPAGEQLR
jgi:hypothetical protein